VGNCSPYPDPGTDTTFRVLVSVVFIVSTHVWSDGTCRFSPPKGFADAFLEGRQLNTKTEVILPAAPDINR
jgi:hypothetical protein